MVIDLNNQISASFGIASVVTKMVAVVMIMAMIVRKVVV